MRRERLRVYFLWILCGAVVALHFFYQEQLWPERNQPRGQTHILESQSQKKPTRLICEEPLQVSLGTIDQQFNLSLGEAKKFVADATAEWKDATGIEWFRLSDRRGELVVNFLYDGRQDSLGRLASEAKAMEAQLSFIKEHEPVSPTLVAELLAGLEGYRTRREQLRTPTPWAQYQQGLPGRSIDVFAYNDEAQLHAILLHELGHALGLAHLPQPEAIMHELREVGIGDVHLSQADIEAALSLCEELNQS